MVADLTAVAGESDPDLPLDESAPEFQVNLDPLKLQEAGLDTVQTAAILQAVFIVAKTIYQYITGGNEFDSCLSLAEKTA